MNLSALYEGHWSVLGDYPNSLAKKKRKKDDFTPIVGKKTVKGIRDSQKMKNSDGKSS